MNTTVIKPSFPVPSTPAVSAFLRRWWWLAAAFLLVYGSIIPTMVHEWWTNDDYAHGLFTPFAVAYLVYERRQELIRIPSDPSALGFLMILASQAVLIVGFLGAEFFLQRISMLMFFAGLILFLWGWHALSRTAFGLILILLAIPLPTLIFNSFALPLQLLASSLAESVLDLLHVSVFRDGNILQLPHGLFLNVAEACSGIRSLISLIALAALTTMLARFRMSWWARIVVVLSAVPIALAGNAFRVTGTALLANSFGIGAAEGFLHASGGWLVFIFAFAVLLSELFFLARLAPPPSRRVSAG